MSVLSLFARRFVAGEDARAAVRAARALNEQGLAATLDFLGEDTADRSQAAAAAAEYRELLTRIADAGLKANVSLKLTQLGLGLDPSLCRDLLGEVVGTARRLENFVRIDMEGSAWTQATLDAFYALGDAAHAGVVIQAMLRRSEADVRELNRRGARVRLCKGAYKEPPALAFPDKAEVNANYDRLAALLLEGGSLPAIATHDEGRIEAAVAAARRLGLGPERWELQMLYGIRRRRARRLAEDGHRVRIYVPYGTHWLPYFSRRLRERKENWLFVLKNLWKD